MPYVGIHTSKQLTGADKERIKTGLGAAISLIPNKREELLLVEFLDGNTMYMGGKQELPAAYVNVRCYKSAPYEDNKAFTEHVYQILGEIPGLETGQVYVTITEYEHWGSKGTLK